MAVSGVLPVASDGSTPFPTLRDAIAAAQAGDTITVAPGVYDETADPIVAEIAVESITLIGLGDLPSDASITGAHIWFHASGVHHVENLRFFGDVRLLSGYPPSSMTMRNCVVDDRVDSDHGDTITIESEALVQDCVFQNLETFGAGEARVEVTMPDELSGGTYYVRLETPDGVRTARLVLLR